MSDKHSIRPEEYLVISAFMIHELALKGVKLMVYAMIYGYSKNKAGCFYGSIPWLASWLSASVEGVRVALKELEAEGLILQVGKHRQGSHETKKFIVNQEIVDRILTGQNEQETSPQKIRGEEISPLKSVGDHPKNLGVTPQKIWGDNIYNLVNKLRDINNKPPTPSEIETIKSILAYFEQQAKKPIVPTVMDLQLLFDQLRQGYSEDDCKRVIDIKCSAWLDDPNMNKWLRLKTLFGNKFAKYAEEQIPPEVMYREYRFDL